MVLNTIAMAEQYQNTFWC